MTSDDQFDQAMSDWMEQTAPTALPVRVLDATFERTRGSRQQVGLRTHLADLLTARSALAIGTTAAVVVAAVLVLNPRVDPSDVGELPTTPDAWSFVSIDSRWAAAQFDDLVAGPRGLLGILGQNGSHDMQLSVSTDGRAWTLVPNDQFPFDARLLSPDGFPLPAVVTTESFLFVADGNDVWASGDGVAWQRRADDAQDPDLQAGTIHAVAAGGPELVAVGSDNTAWYSEDGSDWTLAEVPAPPSEAFLAEGLPEPTVAMQGVAVAGDTLVAWGNAAVNDGASGTMVVPVLWTSDDGISWAAIGDVTGIGRLQDMVAGPDGFVAIGVGDAADTVGVWFSGDGRTWQPADGIQDDNEAADLSVSSIAATRAGYVAAGAEGLCVEEPCTGAVAAIWSSPDGRSWARVRPDDRFQVADPRSSPNDSGAWVMSAASWGSRFAVAGAYDGSPAIWISGTPDVTEAPDVTATPSETPASEATATTVPNMSASPASAPIEQLEAWLAARVAGVGAEGIVDTEDDRGDGRCNGFFEAMCRIEEVPLLYATTSGSRYERYEIERVDAPEGDFMVRLFADDGATVVEQPIMWIDSRFLSLVPAMTENGQPVAVPFVFLDGALSASAARPWAVTHQAFNYGLSTDGQYGGERISFVPDPYLSTAACEGPSSPADAAALAETIRACIQFEATAPVDISVGGATGLVLDVTLAPGASVWPDADGNSTVVLSAVRYPYDGASWRASIGPDSRVRLYLVDLPEGSSARIMAIAIGAPQERFEMVVEAATPVLDSIAFQAP